ncbi:hypothetical protein Btru_077758 [Bulinus truncatus]|nr:hypothetical protein Btru_077758 [Bulinus truncatus]
MDEAESNQNSCPNCQLCFFHCKNYMSDHHIPDSVVPSHCTQGADSNFSWLTLPSQLVIKKSKLPATGVGVFPQSYIPAGTIFGPLVGQAYKAANDYIDLPCTYWKFKDGSPLYRIDCGDTRQSNWMRWVNTARRAQDTTAIVCECGGEIYFRTVIKLNDDMELLNHDKKEYFRPVEKLYIKLKSVTASESCTKAIQSKSTPSVSPSTHTLKQSLLMNDPGTGLSKSPDYFLWHKPSVMASANSADVNQQKCIYSHLNIEESFEVDKSKFEQNTDVQKAASISFPENFEDRIIAQKPNNFNDTLEKDNYSYLLFIKGLFLCLKCKMKWSANYTLFFMHIWQQHSHDDDNFACCPDGFSLKCEKLKKVLISVYRKSPESNDVLKRHLLNQQHDSIASETVSLSHSSINKTQKMSSNEMNFPTSGQTSCQNVTEEITRMNIISNEDKTRIVENLLNETTVSMKKESLK